jgi:DNA polymerase
VTDPRLIDHLELLEELGIDGFTRDPVWRRRGDPGADRAGSAGEVEGPRRGLADTPRQEPRAGQAEQAPAVRAPAGPSGHDRGALHAEPVERDARAAPGLGDPASPAVREGGGAAAARDRRPAAGRGGAGAFAAAPAGLFAEAEPVGPEPPADPAAALDAIRADIGDCTRCKLHTLGRTKIVFGVGNPRADLMFVGEAPGADEDEQGIPFVGRAGQLLTRIIEAIGLKREDVYIANVIKCRPPGNRNPEPDEVATCEPFLLRQIDAIRPKVIVALGTFAARTLVGANVPISRLRGRVFTCRGARLVPTFHPAYLLRNPEAKRDTWEDMKKVRRLLAGEAAD